MFYVSKISKTGCKTFFFFKIKFIVRAGSGPKFCGKTNTANHDMQPYKRAVDRQALLHRAKIFFSPLVLL